MSQAQQPARCRQDEPVLSPQNHCEFLMHCAAVRFRFLAAIQQHLCSSIFFVRLHQDRSVASDLQTQICAQDRMACFGDRSSENSRPSHYQRLNSACFRPSHCQRLSSACFRPSHCRRLNSAVSARLTWPMLCGRALTFS